MKDSVKLKENEQFRKCFSFGSIAFGLVVQILFLAPIFYCWEYKYPYNPGNPPEQVYRFFSSFEILYKHWLLPLNIILLLISTATIVFNVLDLVYFSKKNKNHQIVNYLLVGGTFLLFIAALICTSGFGTF